MKVTPGSIDELLAPFGPKVVSLANAARRRITTLVPHAVERLRPGWGLIGYSAPPAAFDWLLLAALGMLGGSGHLLFLHAYRLAPASAVTPFLYLQLVSMVALGYLVFGDVPDVWTLAGSSIVIASGVYLVHREQMRQRVR